MVTTGATPVLTPAETRALFDGIASQADFVKLLAPGEAPVARRYRVIHPAPSRKQPA